MNHTKTQLAQLSAQEKRALLKKLLRQKATQTFPLSEGQKALWVLHQNHPENSAYNVAGVIRVRSPLDIARLKEAFQALINRQAALRTTFEAREDGPVQVVHAYQKLTFEQIDASAWNSSVLNQQLRASYERPFDLEKGPLVRITLFTQTEQNHILLLTVHHIVVDGWSIWLMLDELRHLYGGQPLPPLKLQYTDYVQWQANMLRREGERLRRYWLKQLEGPLPVLNLPTDYARPPIQRLKGASYVFKLSDSLSQQIKQAARSQGVTPYTFFLATFQLLLYRYTGQHDILVGSSTGGRNQPQFAKLIGYFVNPVVLRADLAGNPTFEAFLGQVRRTVLDAIAHQAYPFALLVQQLQPKRDPSRSPIFQVLFTLEKAQQASEMMALFTGEAGTSLDWLGLQLEPYEMAQQEGQFELTLNIVEDKESFTPVITYNTDLFKPSTIERMGTHFKTLLAAASQASGQRISDLPLLTEAERHQLLIDWNQTQRRYPHSIGIHHLFEQQVERTPAAIAVVVPDAQRLSYAALNARANQLAHHLQKIGVGTESLVGICIERSLEMVIALLGVLKAGGAYVPLDPGYPQERLAFMVEDAQLSVLLTQQSLLNQLNLPDVPTVLSLDSQWHLIASESDTNPISGVTPENLAYVIYTSGSTGKPKGVMISHRAICNQMHWVQETFNLTPQDKLLQKTPFSFDASVKEFFMPLLVGAQLVMAKPDGHQDGAYLVSVMISQQITILQLVPSLLRVLVYEPGFADCIHLRHIFCAGEALPVGLHDRCLAIQGAKLHNLYGPTEAAIDVTHWPCRVEQGLGTTPAWRERGTVPIGKAIANIQLYILDAHQQPVPIGVPGELHIGGTGLARGYLNRPELTKERFLAKVNFGAQWRGHRLYKTGDLVRYLPDGNACADEGSIEFLGRLDHQVKIRGYRIELGEIEAALMQHPEVQQAVVSVVEDGSDKRLVAYVVGKATSSLLRHHLTEKVPHYMMPATFVMLDELPLTPNGKVNRRALPAPSTDLSSSFVAPRTPLERTLATLWADVLGRAQIGIHDNFFELGGDSILSIQIVARAKEAGLSFTPKQLFQHQTIAALAAAHQPRSIQAEQGLITGPVPLTPIQHWFFEQQQPEPHHFNQALLLNVAPTLQPAPLKQALNHLLHHHDALRLRFTPPHEDENQTGRWQQKNIGTANEWPFSLYDLSEHPSEAQQAAIEASASQLQRTLNLSEGPLTQAALFQLGPNNPARLLLIIHHLAVDAVSWRILLADLLQAYQQAVKGLPIELPAKTTSFKAWAERLTDYAQSDALTAELAYWTRRPRQVSPLPRTFAGTNSVASAAQLESTLSKEETHALLHQLPARIKSQISEVLLTAILLAFAQWTGEQSLLIDIEGHGREELFDDIDLSRTVGWFTTLFPLHLQIEKGAAPLEALKSIKEQWRRLPNKGIGYGLLRYIHQDAATRAQLKARPQAEVSFNYLGQLDQMPTDAPLLAPRLGGTESSGATRSQLGKRSHLLEINALVLESRLQFQWTYSQNLHQKTTILALAQACTEALKTIIAHCQSLPPRPSDFPLANLNQQTLDQLLNAHAPSQIEELYPLTSTQQTMLRETLAAKASGVYFIQISLQLRGELNPAHFEQAWQQVVERHAILRSVFLWQGLDNPLQLVHKHVKLPFEEIDWRHLSPIEQEKRLTAMLQAEREQGFDLSEAPPMRCTLIQRAEQSTQFVLNTHALLLDGWSIGIILKEILAFYQAQRQGQPPAQITIEPPRPYRDHIAWLQQQDLAKAEAFWKKYLRGITTPTRLRPTKQTQTSTIEQNTLHLSKQTTQALQSFALRHHLTLNILIQGAWATLLSRHSGQTDILFSATVSGRPAELPGVESIVGQFVNSLPVRLSVPSQRTQLRWLQELMQKQAAWEEYSYSPLDQIQAWSELDQSPHLFESNIRFQNYPIAKQALQKWSQQLELREIHWIDWWHYPLNLIVQPEPNLSLTFTYNKQYFDSSTINQLLQELKTLLEQYLVTGEE